MKHIFLLLGVIVLLATTGCVYEGHRGWHHRYYREYHGYSEWPTYPEAGVDVHIHAEH